MSRSFRFACPRVLSEDKCCGADLGAFGKRNLVTAFVMCNLIALRQMQTMHTVKSIASSSVCRVVHGMQPASRRCSACARRRADTLVQTDADADSEADPGPRLDAWCAAVASTPPELPVQP